MIERISKQIYKYKTAVLYSSSSIIKAFATMLVGFIIAKYVSPEDLGLWSSLSLALTYSVFIQGGVINGLSLELPFAYGKGDNKKAEKLAAVTKTFTLAISILVLIAGIVLFYVFPSDSQKLRYGILGITCIVILTFYQTYLMSTYRSNNSFTKLSKLQFYEAIFNVCSIVLVIYFTYYGMIMKAVITLLFFVILLHIFRPIKTKFYWDGKLFSSILKVGFPIFVLVLMDSAVNTIDKVWLIKYTNLDQVGLYTFGLYSLNLFMLFSSSIASYVYPKMTYSYAKLNDKLLLWHYMKKITFVLLLIQAPLVIIGYFLIPSLVEQFFPKYSASTQVLQILLIAGMVKGSVIGVNILWSMKSWKYMYSYQIFYTIIIIGSTYLGVHAFTNKIVGVALGVLFANILNLFSAVILSYKATHTKNYEKIIE